jgi:hypothetical protein
MSSSAKEKERPEAAIKKKSTFSKIADIVSKSPIIEQFKRPQRQSKLKSSASNVSDLSDRTNNLSTVSGLVTGSKSKAALSSLKNNKDDEEDEENENLKPLVEETKPRRVSSRNKK